LSITNKHQMFINTKILIIPSKNYYNITIIISLEIFFILYKYIMTYNIATLWAIYLIILVISFIIFYYILKSSNKCCDSVKIGNVLLLASILGAIAVFIGAIWLNTNQLTTGQQAALSILFIIAFLLPIFIILYIVYSGECSLVTECKERCPTTDTCPKIKKTIHCDKDTGICQVTQEEIQMDNNVTTVVYSSQ